MESLSPKSSPKRASNAFGKSRIVGRSGNKAPPPSQKKNKVDYRPPKPKKNLKTI